MIKIALASNNAKKVLQISQALQQISKNIKLCSLEDLKYKKEIIESGKTFKENSLIKARQVCKETGLITIADDSGICIQALKNKPGLFSARFAAEFKDRKACLEHVIKQCTLKNKWKCKYVASLACVFPNGKEYTCIGQLHGTISKQIVELNKMMTYDPIFIPKGYQTCVSTWKVDDIIKINHRGVALVKLIKKIKNKLIEKS